MIEDIGPLPCKWCNASTARATMNHYGARCFQCYEAYVREPQTYPDVGDRRIDQKSWAWALKRRHEAGERLTWAQIEMYRVVTERYEPEPESTE